MAQRRMFNKEITNSSEFQMMAPSSQNLYFHFGMNADDDGFCEVFTIMRMTESKPDDLKALHEKGFIYVINSKVAIVKDWHKNNQMRADRYKQSAYLQDKVFRETYLAIMEEKIKDIDQYRELLSSWQPNGNQMAPQYSIGKVSIGNNTYTSATLTNVSKNEENDASFKSFWDTYPRKVEKKKALQKWVKLPKETQCLILQDIQKRKGGRQWREGFIPHPTTYLNGERWNDELEVEPENKIIRF